MDPNQQHGPLMTTAGTATTTSAAAAQSGGNYGTVEISANNNNNNNNNTLDGGGSAEKGQKEKVPPIVLNKWNWFGKFRAVFLKNLARQKRQYRSNLCQIIFPLLLVGFSGGLNMLFIVLFKWIIIVPDFPPISPFFYNTDEHGFADLQTYYSYNCFNSSTGQIDWNFDNTDAIEGFLKIATVKDGTLNQELGSMNSDGTASGLFAELPRFNYTRQYYGKCGQGICPYYLDCEIAHMKLPFTTDLTSLRKSDVPVDEWLDEMLYNNITGLNGIAGTCIASEQAYQSCINTAHTVPSSAIIFHEYSPTKLSYTIQTSSTSVSPPSDSLRTDFASVPLETGTHRFVLANLLNSAFIQRHIDSDVGSQLAFTAVSKEYPQFSFPSMDKMFIPNLIAMVLFSVAVTFLLPQYMYETTYERSLGLKEIAKMMGLDRKIDWLSRFIFDYLLYFGIVVFMIVLSAILQLGIFIGTNPLWWVLLFFFWGHAQIALGYFLASLFSNPRTATVVGYLVVLINAVGGWILNLVVLRTSEIVLSTAWLYLYPPVAFFRGMGLITLSLVDTSDVVPPWFEYEIVLQIAALAFSTIVLHILAAYFELIIPHGVGIAKNPLFFIIDPIRNSIRFIRKKSRSKTAAQNHNADTSQSTELQSQQQPSNVALSTTEDDGHTISITTNSEENQNRDDGEVEVLQDAEKEKKEAAELEEELEEEFEEEDVAAERESIKEGLLCEDIDFEQQIVVINNIFKYWRIRTHKKYALKGVTLGIRSNECFGLLGPNGAGKTTLIKCLSGLDRPSAGGAIIGGLDLWRDLESIYHLIGICPQFDVLYPDLTVEEHLLFYSRLKGVPWKHEKRHVAAVIDEVGLSEARRRFARNLSGGMKRRLSIAIALTGSPKVVLLDEPTTGLDPASKQAVWEVIEKAKSKQRCIILTTHNMEEAESLCDRIGIMVAGKLRCLGSPQRLKSKFGEGFRIVLSCNPDAMSSDCQNRVDKLMKSLIPLVSLEGAFPNGTFVYRVQHTQDLQLSTFFPSMEKLKHSFGITDWALSQASLEEVFLGLVSRYVSAADAE